MRDLVDSQVEGASRRGERPEANRAVRMSFGRPSGGFPGGTLPPSLQRPLALRHLPIPRPLLTVNGLVPPGGPGLCQQQEKRAEQHLHRERAHDEEGREALCESWCEQVDEQSPRPAHDELALHSRCGSGPKTCDKPPHENRWARHLPGGTSANGAECCAGAGQAE